MRLLIPLGIAVLIAAPAAAQGQQDFSKVEITTTKISNNFVALDGQGGRIGVLYGPDGIFMVDSQFAPLSEKITAAIRKVSDQKISSWSTRTCTATTPAATRTSARRAPPSWPGRC